MSDTRRSATRRCSCVPTWWSRLGASYSPWLDAWTAEKADFPDYDSGSDGPNAADELLARDGGRVWRPVAQLSEHKT
jgi:hypothetical protein